MIPENFIAALSQIVSALEGKDISWAVTGSMGFALQGVPVTPNDIDLQTDTVGAYEIEQHFCDQVVRSVTRKTSEQMRSMLGRFMLGDVKVEIMGDVQKCQPDDTWEPPVDIEEHKRWIEFEGMQVPVLDLAYEQMAYLKMGRLETAAMLGDWLEGRGQDNNEQK